MSTQITSPQNEAEMISVREIERMLGISKSVWYAGIKLGDYPYGVHTARKARRWPRDAVLRIQREGIEPGRFAAENAACERAHEQRLARWVTRAGTHAQIRKGVRHG